MLSDPEAHIVAMLPSAFNELIESGLRSLPNLLSSFMVAPPTRAAAETYTASAHAVPSGDIEISEDFGIAVVTARGIITPYASELWERAVDPRGLANTLRSLAARGDIRTIVLYIDSPGGHAIGLPELSSAMAEVRKEVELIAYGDKLIASAAYWMAAGCDAIFAAPSAAIGSIGVYCPIYSFEGLIEKLGIKLNLFRDGSLKGLGLFGKELTKEEADHIEAGVIEISKEFKGFVRERRGNVADFTMQGQCHDGKHCPELGLADGMFNSLSELVADLVA